MSDPRLSWLLGPSALGGLLAATGSSPASAGSDPAVQAWLSGGGGSNQSKLLSAFVRRDDPKTLCFTTEVGALAQQQPGEILQELHLIRLDSGSADASASSSSSPEEFAKQVLITNTSGDAVQGLYELIHSVFAPKLLGSESTHTAQSNAQHAAQ